MRIALLSDIHANFEALRGFADVLREAEKVVCLGDLVGYYCQVNEVIDYMRSLDALCILGNHDGFLVHGCPADANASVRFGIEFADRAVSSDNRRWLATLPVVWGGVLGGRSVLLTHGSPWRPLTDYLYPDTPALAHLDGFDFDMIAFGQTHHPFQRTEQRPWLLNPGSVGQPRGGNTHACAMLIDTTAMTVERIERSFDAARVIDLAVRNGAGPWVRKHLLPSVGAAGLP